jgi:hypothetical protein
MRKFVVTTALALVLAGSAYAQGHHGGGGGGGGGGGMGGGGGGGAAAHVGGGGGPGFSGGAAVNGGGHFSGGGPSMMSRGPSGASTFNGGSSRQFSRTNQGPQGRTVYNQERGNRNLYNRYEGENRNRFEGREGNRFEGREGNRFEGRNEHGNHGIQVGHANINEFRHGINHGNFFVHGRHFGFRRFWNDQWVFLTGWDDCTAWAWVAVAPGVFAWAPIDVCIG